MIRELAEGGMTMLIATHEMGFARDVASRVASSMTDVILEEGPPEGDLRRAEARSGHASSSQRIVAAGRM